MTEPKPTARLFAAIWLPEYVVADLQGFLAQQPAPARVGAAIHPTRADTWHVTLAFLGSVPLEPALRRFANLGEAGPPSAQPVRLAGSGAFGTASWIGVEHGPWLTVLAGITQRLLRVVDTRFRAHVTVGRARGADPAPAARAHAEALRDYRGPEWVPQEVLLVQSLLGPQPQYPVRDRHPLKPDLSRG